MIKQGVHRVSRLAIPTQVQRALRAVPVLYEFTTVPTPNFAIQNVRKQLRLPYVRCIFTLPDATGTTFIASQLRNGNIRIWDEHGKSRSCTIRFTPLGRRFVCRLVLQEDATFPEKLLHTAYAQVLLQLLHYLSRHPSLIPSYGTGGFRVAAPTKGHDDYHVVAITPQRTRYCNAPLGGSHASPRQHDRAGHWRTHPYGGDDIWVESTVVNPGTQGRITKHYALH